MNGKRWAIFVLSTAGYVFSACGDPRQEQPSSAVDPIVADAGAATDGGEEPSTSPPNGPGDRTPGAPATDVPWSLDAGSGSDADAGPPPEPPCDRPVDQVGFVGSQSFEYDGTPQTYELFIAKNYDGRKRLPVVFVFHGDDGSGAMIRSWLQLEWMSGGKAHFVYLDSPTGTWDTFTPPDKNRDYPLVDALAAAVSSKLCVDKKRFFAWGISRGAFFVNHLGCFRGGLFRGIIAYAGGGPSSSNPDDRDENYKFRCTTPPVAALIMHGDADLTVDYSAGVDSRDHWHYANRCSDDYVNTGPGPCIRYVGCRNPVGWCSLHGQDHGLWTPSQQATWEFIEQFEP